VPRRPLHHCAKTSDNAVSYTASMEYVQFGEKGILKRQTQADMGVSQGIAKGFASAHICGNLFVAVQGTVPTITTYTSTSEMVRLNEKDVTRSCVQWDAPSQCNLTYLLIYNNVAQLRHQYLRYVVILVSHHMGHHLRVTPRLFTFLLHTYITPTRSRVYEISRWQMDNATMLTGL
jgi:hypothetical protein